MAQNTVQLRDQDLRLAHIAERMMGANAALCASTMPLSGMVLHSADQYPDAVAGKMFGNGPLGVALVLPDSPAAHAGLREDDKIVIIAGVAVDERTPPEGGHLREVAFDVLAAQPAGVPVRIVAKRGNAVVEALVMAPPGCRALVEIVTGEGLMGRSDGRVIQISYNLAAMLDDDGLAVTFAHELAHVVLEHRRRLEAAGIDKGLLGEFGRNQQANRQVEVEADRLSAHLLANAGYDPAIAPAFWNSVTGRRAGGGLMRSFVYPSATARGDLIAREIALYLPLGRGPSWPGHLLALRDGAF